MLHYILKFNHGRYGDLIQKYEVSLSRMLNDILTLDQLWLPHRSDFPPISWPWYRLWPSSNHLWFPWSICNGCCMPAGNAYPSRHLVPYPHFWSFLCSNCWPRFPEFAMSLLDFSPRIPLKSFSIVLWMTTVRVFVKIISIPDEEFFLETPVGRPLHALSKLYNTNVPNGFVPPLNVRHCIALFCPPLLLI